MDAGNTLRLELIQTIPNWEARLSSKILEKRAFVGGLANLGRAALRGMGTGAKWGAGIGAAYGGGKAALSDDPNASVVGGALKGGLSGGMTGAGLGAGIGAGLRAAPGMLRSATGIASRAGFHGAAKGLRKVKGVVHKMRRGAGLGGRNVAAPTWASNLYQKARGTPPTP